MVLVGAAYIVDAPDMTLWWSDMEMDEGGGGARGGGMPGALFIDDVIILWLDTAVSCSNMDSEGPKPGCVSVGGGGGEAWGPSGDVEVCPGGP